MDPALGVMSPLLHEAHGIDGMLEDAVEEITGNAFLDSFPMESPNAGGAAGSSSPAEVPAGTPCSFCSQSSTTRLLPKDGLYVCAGCVAKQGDAPRSFPLGTFKCCPTSTEGVDGDVVRCAGCFRWYHAHCVGITDGVLRSYVTLSTTSWYCPEPTCCDRVLQRHLKR
ncbi:hypothetical protein ABB37_05509 [Leptomonas pyrrhocoris]|uniref:PHD-type domain-containing protein n=1 Tax=Leptomonas pyrrhocoris TaxID=157538 RepID=A0A0N1J4R9_LEPPY|nr:hypothetical protein ABB37_05509 [Leptomonas pyrrhocoris]XP_015658197.1 hypothetical protein ABB37_05509 [Leptomonas pyrrhocoris]KPA79757.1 hypothetical protein ABB37_05509 [Leptomonas pyrrhocoris]KPA79758.1 hypothetical protein ABB37_05509 [Leptomonas pyrrhocoris]|eukprot:XP_015658196.1 hypothetical protein ABB37_05509 [Leptomonas pyrrhocoris]